MFCVGLLECPLDAVVEADRHWRAQIGRSEFCKLRCDLPQMLSRLEPLSGPKTRHLWIATHSKWTTYVDNFVIGSDPQSPIAYLSEILACRGLILSCRPNLNNRLFGQARFDLYGQPPVGLYNLSRSISATNDGGRWSWDTYGDPLPFEDLQSYENKSIRHRLTSEMVVRYARTLGANPFTEDYYCSVGCLVSKSNGFPSRTREVTFEESRKSIGIVRNG